MPPVRVRGPDRTTVHTRLTRPAMVPRARAPWRAPAAAGESARVGRLGPGSGGPVCDVNVCAHAMIV